MSVPAHIIELISIHQNLKVERFRPVSGGCINNGGVLTTNSGEYFLKWNDANRYPSMFETEAKGLRLLSSTSAIRVPKPIEYSVAGSYQYILMEFIDTKGRRKDFWTVLGERLAELHKNSGSHFGLDHDNYIGSLNQYNNRSDDWVAFFINQRLRMQLKLASQNGLADKSLVNSFEVLFKRLDDLLVTEKPSLLHGDLWSGNLIVDDKGEPCLIDPAVYYGHREMEIAFTTLFGGFDESFYDSYNVVFPLEKEFKMRFDIYNLYPLLVHLNLFGRAYLSGIKKIVSRYS
jgi:fructosamine-3-kinase